MTVYGKSGKTMKLFSHSFHRPWKSLRDSHIPTATTTTGMIIFSRKTTNPRWGQFRRAKGANSSRQSHR